MKYGVNLINFGPGARSETLTQWAMLTETLGYHFLMTSDHVAITPDVGERYPAPFYEPFTTLGWLAGVTRRIEIGTTVIVLPYRNPLEVARMAANIDQMSGGRLLFGVGVGWAEKEFAVLGVPFQRRGALTDEYLAAIKTLWTQDVASFTGRYVTFQDVHTAPRPARVPHPPIWVGGASDAAMRRTIRYGDAWHPIRMRTDWLRDVGLPRLRQLAAQEGKPVPALCPRIRLRLSDTPFPEAERVAGEGSLEQIHADLAALQDLGAQYVLLDTFYGDVEATRHPETAWRMLTTLAEQVVDLADGTLR
ncbi:MAG: LLM class F420-dependent oxidoreductase [Candidatus Tectomicrobia bacterium]|uniref:LLM class F420-dependent oxidoreductase n=1 Tax=Tectimicrobiota bacterium TaxID=2528274 RepID=A0A937VZM7_UNCTE|nr:LLM class F420-dependent oxidoreductase [Candidatus Tectomicrobia bacterium]